MNFENIPGIDPVLRKKFVFLEKLLKTDAKVLIDFFADIGIDALTHADSELKKEFEMFMNRINKKLNLPGNVHESKEN